MSKYVDLDASNYWLGQDGVTKIYYEAELLLHVVPDVRPTSEWRHTVNNLYLCNNCLKEEPMFADKKKQYCPHCGRMMK